MRKWLWLLLAMPAMAQTTQVSGKLQTYSPNIAPNALGNYVEFQLTNCGNNTPQVSGSAVLLSKAIDFFPDSTGALSAAANGGLTPRLYGNDVISCGGAFTSRYSVRYYVGGIAQGPAKFYFITSASAFDLTTATPINLQPPLNPPYPNLTTCPPGSYTNGLNKDLSVKCLNLPNGASNAVVTNPTGPQEIANQPLILDGPLTAPSINSILYSKAGDTISSIEAACSTACTYVVSQPQVLTLGSAHTLSSKVNLYFAAAGTWTVNGAALTIPGGVAGTLSQHFIAGTGSVKFGNLQAQANFEWFGAVGDWNGSTGTDNTIPMQACLNAMTSGQCVLQALSYKTTSVLTINKSSVGIIGTSTNFAFAGAFSSTPPGSVIISSSASADVIDVAGVSPTNTIAFNRFEKFTIARSVIPTGTSAGLSINFTFAVTVDSVVVEDSVRGFYIHGNGASGIGRIDNSTVVWGANGVVETTGSLYGFYLDSADGVANPSMRIRNSDVTSTLGAGVTTYGLITTGTAINDLMTYGFETASTSYGEYVIQTGAGTAIASSDIHFYGSINDGCKISCFFVTGTTQAGGAGVEISGGYNTSATGSNPLVDIESATNVRISGLQVGIALNALASAAIDVVSSSDVTITGNQIQGIRNVGILLSGSTAVAITGNDLNGNADANGLINLVNSSFNSVTGNVLTGTGNSIQVDASSNANVGLYDNAIASTLTPASVLGNNPLTNGAAISGKSFQLGAVSTWQQSVGAPSGACTNGSMDSNSLTTAGTFATYQCKSTAWVGVGTAY